MALHKRLILPGIVLIAALATLFSVGHKDSSLTGAVFDPPPGVMTESFSIKAGGFTALSGIHPADILVAGPIVAVPCPGLGLICTDTSGAEDDLNALAYGVDFAAAPDLPGTEFSVAAGSMGLAGTSVRVEASAPCVPAEPQADVFETALTGTNAQDLDGDGASCGGNAGFPLGLCELACGVPADDLDALAQTPSIVDVNGDGIPDNPVYFTLTPSSPSLSDPAIDFSDPGGDATAADILVTVGGFTPTVWADGATQLGLVETGDVIDALCIGENGNGIFDYMGDNVLFSLAPGSPTLTALGAGPADLLRPGPSVVYSASKLGLMSTDNVDALKCPNNVADVGITKSGAPNPLNIGATLTYTLTVTNYGPDTATGVIVTDTLPASVTFVSAPAICVHVSPVVTCSLGSMLPAGTMTIVITVTTTMGGSITNTSSVTANEFDLNPSNNTATRMTTVLFTCTRSAAAGGATVHTVWSNPAGDDDCDGFTTATENHVGTLPLVPCATIVGGNNEPLPDQWPVDFDDNQKATTQDVIPYIPKLNKLPTDPGYDVRFDIDPNNPRINTQDVIKFIPFLNISCVLP
jgi:uncharacterized repeat protein (TIGR01451 family)